MNFIWNRWLNKTSIALFGGKRPVKKSLFKNARLRLEELEEREVPTAYLVTGLGDGAGVITPDNGAHPGIDYDATTLRAAITAATADGNNDTITFAASLFTNNVAAIQLVGSINNAESLGASAFVISTNITIEGPAADGGADDQLIIQGGGSANPFRFATVSSTGSLTLDNITVAGFDEQGGSGGGSGGAGGLGAGGALLNYGGDLILNGVTLAGNSAVGGNATTSRGGTGGGMGTSGASATGGGPNGATATAAAGVGGGGSDVTAYAPGGFGGGGGSSTNGYEGGFGGGGGGSYGTASDTSSDVAGFGGGTGNTFNGSQTGGAGGGAGMGGAIFLLGGTTSITNSTLTDNLAQGGAGDGQGKNTSFGGSGLGGAIFDLNGSLDINNSTFASNLVAGGTSVSSTTVEKGFAAGSGIYNLSDGESQVTAITGTNYTDSVTMNNSILGEGSFSATVADFVSTKISGGATPTLSGANNIISNNTLGSSYVGATDTHTNGNAYDGDTEGAGTGTTFTGGVIATGDPALVATTLSGALTAPTTTLSGAVTAPTTTFALPNSSTLSAADPLGGASLTVANATALGAIVDNVTVLQVDGEQMLVTAGAGANSLTVTPGYNGTAEAAHNSGAAIFNLTAIVPDWTTLSVALVATGSTAAVTLANAGALGPIVNNTTVLQVDGEQMLVTAGAGTNSLTVTRAYNSTAEAAHVSGAAIFNLGAITPDSTTLSAADTAGATSLTVANAAALGTIVDGVTVLQIDSEQMLVTAVNGNTLTVARGYNGTTPAAHASGQAIFNLTASSTDSTTALSAAVSSTTAASLTIANAGALGTLINNVSVIQVDGEQMLVTAGAGTTTLTVIRGYNGTTAATHVSGAVVVNETAAGLLSQQSTMTISVASAAGIAAGTVLEVGTEQMLVTNVSGATLTVTLGYNGTPSGASFASGTTVTLLANVSGQTVTVANAALLGAITPGTTVLAVDGEQMLVTAVSGNTLTVTRGFNASAIAAHASGELIYVSNNGGPTPTAYLQTTAGGFSSNSPAVGAGNSSASGEPAMDQRGDARGSVIDIGAVEVTYSVALPLGIETPAAASPNPVVSTGGVAAVQTTLSVTASGGVGPYVYTWTTTSIPAGANPVTFDSNNGTANGNSEIATFYDAGSYTFQVTVTDSSDPEQSVSSNVTVTVSPLTITSAAAANPNPVVETDTVLGNQTGLSVAAEGGVGPYTYTWTTTSIPAGASPVTFDSNNGTANGNSETATFYAAGSYTFEVTVTDSSSPTPQSVTSSVTVTVDQTLSIIEVSPATPTVSEEANYQFTATGYDQFGNPMATQPTFIWSTTDGTITQNGFLTAPDVAESVTVQATVSDLGEAFPGSASATIAAPALVVSGVSPSSGPLAGGNSVTISGSGFTDATAVDFGTTPVSSADYTVNSDTSITVSDVPATSTAGPVDVTVTTPYGTSATSSADQYTYASSSPPPSVVNVVINGDASSVEIMTASESGNTVTVNTVGQVPFTVGQSIEIAGVAAGGSLVNGYNGIFTVASVLGNNEFTYTDATSGLANAANLNAPNNPDGGASLVRNIQSIAQSGSTVTVTFASPHGFTIGDEITIAGSSASGYDGTWAIVAAPSTTTFTFIDTKTVGSATGGTAVNALIGAQRSEVTTIVYTFSEAVTLNSQAFAIATLAAGGTAPAGVAPTLTWTAIDGTMNANTEWVATFSGNGTTGGNSGANSVLSIANGVYNITLNAADVTAASDGQTMTASRTDTFYRLFGDAYGDERVTALDAGVFSAAYDTKNTASAYLAYLDYTDDAAITALSAGQFSVTYGEKYTGFTPTI